MSSNNEKTTFFIGRSQKLDKISKKLKKKLHCDPNTRWIKLSTTAFPVLYCFRWFESGVLWKPCFENIAQVFKWILFVPVINVNVRVSWQSRWPCPCVFDYTFFKVRNGEYCEDSSYCVNQCSISLNVCFFVGKKIKTISILCEFFVFFQ